MKACYDVRITRQAYSQIAEVRHYIAFELMNPEAAERVLTNILNAIKSLSDMPSRNPLVESEPWYTNGVRKLIVNHFNVYYWIEEQTSKVYVTAVVYQKRDQLQQQELMSFDN